MDLPSVLGGAVQGFKDFGKSALDLFGGGGANILDIIESLQTGKLTSRRQDDFRKWLYDTDDTQDAAAKGLGTALNGIQTISDYIPGLNVVSQNPLFNAGQGALGGIADEFKVYGKDADLGRAGQRALVSGGAALASSGLGNYIGSSASPLATSNTLKGAARGALGGAINQGGYTAIEGGNLSDILKSAGQGATMGGVIGGATGMFQDFKPAKTYDAALTDDEKATRIANIDDQLGKLDLNTPEGSARYNELVQARQRYSGNKRLYRGLSQEYDPNYPKNKLDTQGYESWTDNPELARQYGENVYYIDVPEGDIKTSYLDENPISETYGDRNPIYSIDKKAGLNGVSGNEYLLSVDDPYKEGLTYNRLGGKPKAVADLMNDPQVMQAIDAVLSPEQEAFFKNSKIRDENGNLIKMYHGTPDGSFTEFNEGSYFTPNKEYADGYQWEGASVLRSNKKAVDPKTFEVYINSENPFSLSDPKARDIYLNEYIKGGNSMYYDPYTDWTKAVNELSEVDWTEGEDLRAWLKENHPEYDALYLDEGGNGGYGEAEYKWRGNSIVPFNNNQIKDVNNLKPTNSPDIMEELAVNNDPEVMRAIDSVLGVDNELIQDIKPMDKTARAQQIIDNNADIFKAPVKNKLYDSIDPSTLPPGYAKLIDYLDTQNGPNNVIERKANEYFGTPYIDEVSTDKLLDYVWGNDNLEKKVYKKSLDEAIERNKRTAKSLGLDPDKAVEDAIKSKEQELAGRAYKKLQQEVHDEIRQESGYSDDILHALLGPSNKGVRTGYAGALDTALSERLGIAPGNTIKNNIYYDIPENRTKSLGRSDRSSKDIAINEKGVPPKTKQTADGIIVANTEGNDGIESRLSTMAHERLHSFQSEAEPQNIGRYSKEVTDAYSELRKDLEPFLKSEKELAKRYKDNKAKYWAAQGEQESRMLQNYLDNKRITKNGLYGTRKGEWGNEINPAFDKFFNKLRKLSKKGVALPAITALLGGGAYLTTTADEKDKEIR